ncbi:MAG: hypothetical protein GY765_12925, partial [bacterium]|nr:hypothetical protein [bacterium]
MKIYDGTTLIDTKTVNQKSNGGKWNALGEYTFNGIAKIVIRTASDNCSTSVDAVRFSPSELCVTFEMNEIRIEGPENVSGGTSGTKYICRAYSEGSPGSVVQAETWETDCPDTAQISNEGVLTASQVTSNTPCKIFATYTDGADTWNDSIDIMIIDTPPEPTIIDNGDPGTSSSGTWKVSGVMPPYGSDSLFSKNVGDTYTFETELTGCHEIFLWWTSSNSRCPDVPVEIYDGTTHIDTKTVHQKNDGGKWYALGEYAFNGIAKIVIRTASDNCSTSVDAVR